MITAAVIATTAPAVFATAWTANSEQYTVHLPSVGTTAVYADPAHTAAVTAFAENPAAGHATPTTWHIDGQAVTVHLPTDHATHLVYADSAAVPVAQLAAAPATAPAYNPALSTGTATGAVNGLGAAILIGLIWYAVKHRGHRWGWMFTGIALGTVIASGSIGQMIHGLVGQGLTAVAGALGGING